MPDSTEHLSFTHNGNSYLLELSCSRCNQLIAIYQKDDNSRLLRLYLDRILAPITISKLQKVTKSKQDMSSLVCSKCKALIGIPMVHKTENRLAFRLAHGSFIKKRVAAKTD